MAVQAPTDEKRKGRGEGFVLRFSEGIPNFVEFVDISGYLTVLTCRGWSGHLDCTDCNIVGKLLQTLTMDCTVS